METTSGRLVMILLADLMFAQFSLLGFWAVLGAGVWWRRMCHVAVAVIYIAAVSIPLDEVKYDSVFARFLTPLATSASITGVMILAFLIALRRRWRIGNASESVAEGRHPSQFSIFHLHALTTIVAILTAFFVSMASETNNGVVEVLVVNGFVIFVLMLTVISAVRASLGTASLLPRLCFVCVLAVVLGLIPSLALRASAELFIVWPLITTLPPLFVMASLLSLRASGTRLMVRPMLGSERT
jgi:hypothetical protein